MGFFTRTKPEPEKRSGTVTQSSPNFLEILGLTSNVSVSNVSVTTHAALGIPAFWSAVNFLGGTIAGLPLHVYRRTSSGREKIDSPLSRILHDRPNPETSSFAWRKYTCDQTFTGGRAFSYIERNGRGVVKNIWPLDPSKVTITADGWERRYTFEGRTYAAADIIDLPFMLRQNMIDHYGPVGTLRDALGMAIAASQYGAKAFQSGGIPPAVLQGPFQSGAAAQRASDDVHKAMQRLQSEGRPLLAMPEGHRLEKLGFSPDQMQLLDLQKFCVREIARIFSLPPVFLQDLEFGTYSNTEQQDLHFVKHTVKRWVEQIEQELNLKLFPRDSKMYVEFSVDGLLRGDIKARMDAHSTAIQNGIYTPAHAAKMENAPYDPLADQMFIQGGTMPIGAVSDEAQNGE
jgi:HK97 family phage portal protein